MPSSVQGGAAVRGGGPPRDGSTKWVTAWATKWVRSSVRRAAVVAAVQGGLQGAGRLFLRVVGGHAGSVLVHDGSLRSLSWCVWAAGEPWFARSGTDIGLTARQSLRSGCRPADDQAPLRQRRITTKRRMTTREITPRQQGCPALWPGFSSSETRENVTFTTGEPRPNTGARPCSERPPRALQIDAAAHVGADLAGDDVDELRADGRVDGQRDQGLAALDVPADLHAGDVDLLVAEDPADRADDAGTVHVGEERHVLGRDELHVVAVDLDDPLGVLGAGERPGHRDDRAVGHRAAHLDDVAPVGAVLGGGEGNLDAAVAGEQRRVDERHGLLDHVQEHALERGELEHLHVVLGDLAADDDVEPDGDAAGEGGEDAAELLGERQAGLDVLGDRAALDVDRVRHELAGQRQLHRAGDLRARLLLRLVGAGAEVRGDDDVVVVEQRAVGARLGAEHVEAGAGDPAVLEGDVQRRLVHDAAAGGVDDPDGRLDLVQLAVADEAAGLGRLRQVDGGEVALAQQLVQRDEFHAELGGAGGLYVRVVRDDVHVERGEALGDQDADAAEAEHPDGLALQLDAGVLRPLPLALLEGRVALGDVPRGREQERDGVLGGGDDVGRRRVHDHHAGLGGGLDVDVVEADAGAGDDAQGLGVLEHLGGDLRGAAHDQRVHVPDGGEQLFS